MAEGQQQPQLVAHLGHNHIQAGSAWMRRTHVAAEGVGKEEADEDADNERADGWELPTEVDEDLRHGYSMGSAMVRLLRAQASPKVLPVPETGPGLFRRLPGSNARARGNAPARH